MSVSIKPAYPSPSAASARSGKILLSQTAPAGLISSTVASSSGLASPRTMFQVTNDSSVSTYEQQQRLGAVQRRQMLQQQELQQQQHQQQNQQQQHQHQHQHNLQQQHQQQNQQQLHQQIRQPSVFMQDTSTEIKNIPTTTLPNLKTRTVIHRGNSFNRLLVDASAAKNDVHCSSIDANSHKNSRIEVGLENLGNTCFMNTTLQCLLHIKPLVTFFNIDNINGYINHASPMKGAVAISFAELVREVTSSKEGGVVSPINFKKILTKYAPHLLDYQEQDCQEFLRFLLDSMSSDLCRSKPPATIFPDVKKSPTGSPITSTSDAGATLQQDGSLYDAKLSYPNKVRLAVSGDVSVEGRNPIGTVTGGTSPIHRIENLSLSSPQLHEAASTATTTLLSHSTCMYESSAHESWTAYVNENDSIITDLFGGQLQSTIECQTCMHRSISFDPFLDLSIPIPKSADGAIGSTADLSATDRVGGDSYLINRVPPISRTKRAISSMIASATATATTTADDTMNKCSIQACLEQFVSREILDGDNMVTCSVCQTKRKCTKALSLYRYPQVLCIQIKRFQYTDISREKISADVDFPLHNLDLTPFLSKDIPTASYPPSPVYDLVCVSNHVGNLNNGHYIAYSNTTSSSSSSHTQEPSRWISFDDAKVTVKSESSISGPSAYVLFYMRKE